MFNIVGGGKALNSANFLHPADYLFGTQGWSGSKKQVTSDQMAVYNRGFVGLRIEKVAPETIEALHAYYIALQKRMELPSGNSYFKLMGSRFSNFFRRLILSDIFGADVTLAGNCAVFSSGGLHWCGLINDEHLWPKATFIQA